MPTAGLVFATSAAFARARSEDRAEVFGHDDSLIIVVADGAGGIAGGAVASDAVIAAVRARLRERPFDPQDIRAWSDVLTSADADLARSKNAGETTGVIVVAGAYGLSGVSAGDSEAWLVGRGIDRLTEKQTRARIGTGRARPTAFHRGTFEGVLVVGTDGLFKNAPTDAITACCVGEASVIASKLLELPKLRSGGYPDDVAVVVVTAPPSGRDLQR